MNTTQANGTATDVAASLLNGEIKQNDDASESILTVEELQGPSDDILEEIEQQETVYDIPAFDAEADKWSGTPLAPNGLAEAPLYYVGYDPFLRIARQLGRPLVLWEAQYLVMVDGPLTKCRITGQEFQPVKFFCATPKDLRKQYDEGKRLSGVNAALQVPIRYAGCYYLNEKLEPEAVSGKLVYHNGHHYTYDKKSAFGSMALTLLKRRWRRRIGDCCARAMELSVERKAAREFQRKVSKFADEVMGRRGNRRNH